MEKPSGSGRDESRSRLADWRHVALSYDWQLRLERTALKAAVDLASPDRDDVWLDVGTGTAGLLRELARRPDRPGSATGVDASAAMVGMAPALPERWRLETGDARRLRYADGSFSVVTAAYLLHVVDHVDRRQVIRECRRVLRPGGRFVSVTPTWPRTRVARMLYAPLAAAAESSVGPGAALRPLDPTHDLESEKLTVAQTRYVARGYPSLCALATR